MPALRQPYVSKSNRRGVVLLLLMLILIVFIPRILFLMSEEEYTLSSEEVAIADQLEARTSTRKATHFSYRKKNKYKVPARAFDPNTYTVNDWMALGLSPKQADVVVRFSSRGIRSYEEFDRIAVVPAELKALIRDSLVFPSRKTEYARKERAVEKKKPLIELNAASVDALVELPGIGEYTAAKIIQYRDRLGGFVRSEQLMELKRIDPELYARFDKLISVDEVGVRKLNINTAEIQTLKTHPYFTYHVANSIVKMRQQRGGRFNRIEELLESELIDHELFEKIKPYLTL